MKKQRIIIAGGGFAGLNAARALGSLQNAEVMLFNCNNYTAMLPSLPDLAGNRISSDLVTGDIRGLVPRCTEFVGERILLADLDSRVVRSERSEYPYDYLVISTGARTAFHGFSQNLDRVYTLDSFDSAQRIRDDFSAYLESPADEKNVIISGASYTGLELACALRLSARSRDQDLKITLVDVRDSVLPFLSPGQKKYALQHIRSLDIDLMTGRRVTEFDGHTVTVDDGFTVKNVFFCWTAGSEFGMDISGAVQQITDGRILVDDLLRIPEYTRVFVCGDAAAIHTDTGYLRKAVNFAVYSGRCAGKNIRCSLAGRKLKRFRPADLGWVLPLQSASTGLVFGMIPVRGRKGLFLHYIMTGLRSYRFSQRIRYAARALHELVRTGR